MKTVYNPHVQSILEKTKANLDEPISTYARTHARTHTHAHSRTHSVSVTPPRCHALSLTRTHMPTGGSRRAAWN